MDQIFAQWIALCILFLASSVWSEDNVRFGYIVVPMLAGFFWLIGWIQFTYLGAVIPLVIMMGIISYLRAQLKYKYGVFGSNSGILFKIVVFLIFVQMAMGFINGMNANGQLFGSNYGATPSNEFTTYTLTAANNSFKQSTSDINIVEAVADGLKIAWTMFKIIWGMFAAIFLIYPILEGVFHIPSNLSLLIQCGIYILYAAEMFTMVFKPYKPVEV